MVLKNEKLKDKIILFGGVFDPVHIGHLSIYKTVKQHFKFGKFIIIPSKNPPLKSHQPFANAKNRVNMLKTLFHQYKDVAISNYETSRPDNKVSYTIDTIKHFHKLYSRSQFYFVIGTDRYLDFKKWRQWKEILKLTELIVIKRTHENIKKSIPAIFIDIKPIPISSSSLRALPESRYLTKPVANYIATNGLYIANQVQPLMSKHRFAHTLRVAKLSVALAKSINSKLQHSAYIAAMYHDVAKELPDKEIVKLVKHWDKKQYPTIHTLHGLASTAYVKRFFNINNREILNAIAHHVIPSSKPSTLEMIIYCADKLEPARTNKDVKDRLGYIKLAKRNIKAAFTKLNKEISAHYN